MKHAAKLIAITTLLLVGGCLAQPTVTLSKSNGPPTTKLLVSGSGFDPDSAVDIYFDTKDLALAVTDGTGAFGQIGIQVPGSAKPGGHWVTGVERYKGLAGQSRFLVETNWAEFHFSPNLNGFNPYENVLSPANIGRMGLRWSYKAPPPPAGFSSATVANGVVYAQSGDILYALDASTGTPMWKYATVNGGNYSDSMPAVANGVVYFGSADYNVYALNARTGVLLWKYPTGWLVECSPAVANGAVYVQSDAVYALNARTGALLWKYTLDQSSVSSPAVANGVVYVVSFDGYVYALNASTGALLWKYNTTMDFMVSSPAVANGVVYVGASDDNIYALNASTGVLLWKYATGQPVGSSPAVANGVVYVGSGDFNVYALNASTGALLWRYTTGDVVDSSPTVANGVVYVSSRDFNVYALNASTGALLWKYATGSGADANPAVANGVVYLSSYVPYFNVNALNAFDLTGSDMKTAPQPPDPKSLVPDLHLKASEPVLRPDARN